MESRARKSAARTLVGLMGLFSAKAQLDKTINFKDSSHATDYRYTLTRGSDPYGATKSYQPLFDQLNHGECGADTNVDYIPVYYTTLQQWVSKNHYISTLYRGAGETMNQTFEECLKFLVNISDARYKQFLDDFDADEKRKAETGTTILFSGLGVLAGIVAIFLITAFATYYYRLNNEKKRLETYENISDVQDDSEVIVIDETKPAASAVEVKPDKPSFKA